MGVPGPLQLRVAWWLCESLDAAGGCGPMDLGRMDGRMRPSPHATFHMLLCGAEPVFEILYFGVQSFGQMGAEAGEVFFD